MASSSLAGGSAAGAVFAVILCAYVLQTELTQYVQSALQYRQPYLLFYIAHSSFIVVLPLHLLWLKWSTGNSISYYTRSLWSVMQHQILARQSTVQDDPKFPWTRYVVFVSLITAGMTCPALLWYASVSLAPVSDVTAIFNTHAFWAYLLSTALIPPANGTSRWQPHKLAAVLLACAGVFATVYGSADTSEAAGSAAVTTTSSTAFLGNILTLISAVSYALYQVAYKRYAVPDVGRDGYEALSDGGETGIQITTGGGSELPFGLFANFVTSTAGLATLGVLWVPVAVMHWAGESKFELPGDWWTTACVGMIALSGLTFNAGFMILLSLWGPIVASVGNLLTIVLVMIADVIISRSISVITFWGFVGSALIILGFAILVFEYTTLRA
ncbi:hypothetical protein BDV93DRAFT_578241 [Ceratobasidium sp. AG-I]|nr:hypothetical protein BDV93DRAFT_578241 [Ceratobasidium sp. AG-I]